MAKCVNVDKGEELMPINQGTILSKCNIYPFNGPHRYDRHFFSYSDKTDNITEGHLN